MANLARRDSLSHYRRCLPFPWARSALIGSPEALTQTLLLFLVLVTLLALGTFLRFYLVSWLGERVSADLRKAVFQHLLQLHPGFFETNLSGEIQARITADTTVWVAGVQ